MTDRYLRSPRVTVKDRAREFEAKQQAESSKCPRTTPATTPVVSRKPSRIPPSSDKSSREDVQDDGKERNVISATCNEDSATNNNDGSCECENRQPLSSSSTTRESQISCKTTDDDDDVDGIRPVDHCVNVVDICQNSLNKSNETTTTTSDQSILIPDVTSSSQNVAASDPLPLPVSIIYDDWSSVDYGLSMLSRQISPTKRSGMLLTSDSPDTISERLRGWYQVLQQRRNSRQQPSLNDSDTLVVTTERSCSPSSVQVVVADELVDHLNSGNNGGASKRKVLEVGGGVYESCEEASDAIQRSSALHVGQLSCTSGNDASSICVTPSPSVVRYCSNGTHHKDATNVAVVTQVPPQVSLASLETVASTQEEEESIFRQDNFKIQTTDASSKNKQQQQQKKKKKNWEKERTFVEVEDDDDEADRHCEKSCNKISVEEEKKCGITELLTSIQKIRDEFELHNSNLAQNEYNTNDDDDDNDVWLSKNEIEKRCLVENSFDQQGFEICAAKNNNGSLNNCSSFSQTSALSCGGEIDRHHRRNNNNGNNNSNARVVACRTNCSESCGRRGGAGGGKRRNESGNPKKPFCENGELDERVIAEKVWITSGKVEEDIGEAYLPVGEGGTLRIPLDIDVHSENQNDDNRSWNGHLLKLVDDGSRMERWSKPVNSGGTSRITDKVVSTTSTFSPKAYPSTSASTIASAGQSVPSPRRILTQQQQQWQQVGGGGTRFQWPQRTAASFANTGQPPLSPPTKAHVKPKPELPAYFTVRRRPALRKVSSDPNSYESGAHSDGEKVDLDEIGFILGELDFSKFRRGATGSKSGTTTTPGFLQHQQSLPPAISPQSQIRGLQRTPVRSVPDQPTTTGSFSRGQKHVTPQKSHYEKLQELRELTEKLKPTINKAREEVNLTSKVPINVYEDHRQSRCRSLPRRPHPVFRSSSEPDVDDLGVKPEEEDSWLSSVPVTYATTKPPISAISINKEKPAFGSAGIAATLPRKQRMEDNELSRRSGRNFRSDMEDDNLRPSRSNLSLDSASDLVSDEGLVADSDLASSSYAQTYRNVTSSVSAPSTPGPYHRNVPSSSGTTKGTTFDYQVEAALAKLQGGTTTAGQNASLQYNSLDRRKRRKGIGWYVGFPPRGSDGKATGNGRSLTYPPQRRSSISEGMEFTSVDSNGIRSYGACGGGDDDGDVTSSGGGPLATRNMQYQRQDAKQDYPSELSLADSHLSPGGSSYEVTFGDVLKSVTNEAVDLQAYEEGVSGNGKPLKKKHYSDPSGEKKNEGLLELPELMACSKSEPQLPSNKTVNEDSSTEVDCVRSLAMVTTPIDRCPSLIPLNRQSGILRTSSLSPVRSESDVCQRFADSRRDPKSPQQQRRYSKKRLRGPYGELLEEEMRKSGEKQLQKLTIPEELLAEQKPTATSSSSTLSSSDGHSGFVERSSSPTSPPELQRHHHSSRSLDETSLRTNSGGGDVCLNVRQASVSIPLSTSDDSGFREMSPPSLCTNGNSGGVSTPWNLRDGLDGQGADCEDLESFLKRHQDTRTHVVAELYDTEKSYVDSLQILVNKYFWPLKSQESSGLVDANLVDEMFFQIPEILSHHEVFLDVLRHRLESWDNKQKVGDVFVESFTKQTVIDTYTAFINNWKTAKEAIKTASQAKPAFAKFLEHMSREHKGKLTLDALLIMPVQRIPRYELLIKELIKHTQIDHPDHRLLVIAQKEVHDLAVKINHMEREAYEAEQMQSRLKEMEGVIEGLIDLVHPNRTFIRYDLVTMSGSLGTKKERCLFLFSDLLIITSIKRKSGTIRKTSTLGSPGSLSSVLEMNKYKLLMRISLDDLDIARSNDSNIKKVLNEIQLLEDDTAMLNQIGDLAGGLNCPHQNLDDVVKEILANVTKQLQEKQTSDTQLLCLELTVTTQVGMETMSIIFTAPDKRASWEAAFHEVKQKLALSTDRRPPPEFMYPLPIRKTRAGLQFTCAASTLGLNAHNLRDVWVCNSDGYVGQVCILSLQPDPTVTSCNGVCNARILCITSIPSASTEGYGAHRRSAFLDSKSGVSIAIEDVDDEEELCAGNLDIQLDSESSEEEKETNSEDDENVKKKSEIVQNDDNKQDEQVDSMEPTMWLGTEDGCIHVYNCNDNIRIKKNKVKLQHGAAIQCIIYLDGKVFVSLANGDLTVYLKDPNKGWNTGEPVTVTVGTAAAPITKMIAVQGKLWCGCLCTAKIINTVTLEIEHSIQVHSDNSRPIQCMATAGLGVWMSLQNSAVVRLYHSTTYEALLDVNVSPAVTKMLAGCDDIIRQHKAACLRITSLLACKDLLWVGTSAGVILNLALPHLTPTTTKLSSTPNVAGISHGHTGHVRFLTCVEMTPPQDGIGRAKYSHRSIKYKDSAGRRASTTTLGSNRLLVISGGDGYEDFRSTNCSEAAGRDDSTNHLLLWQV